MMHRSSAKAVVFLIPLLCAAGCQSRLKHDAKVELPSMEFKTFYIDGPRHLQTAEIAIDSTNGPVQVFVCARRNHEKVMHAVEGGKEPPDTYAKGNVQNGSLEATVPAGEEFAVVVFNSTSKPTTVSVKIRGK